MKDSVVKHLKENNFINYSQRGFTTKRSCPANLGLLSFLEVATDYIDQGLPVEVIYIDFQKIFDNVPRALLLQKVRAHGITGITAQWIESWLGGRKQRLVIIGKK